MNLLKSDTTCKVHKLMVRMTDCSRARVHSQAHCASYILYIYKKYALLE